MTSGSASPGARIQGPIDPTHLVRLTGNTHPLARPEFDRGKAPSDLPLDRMILVLKSSPEQETALHQLLDAQQTRGSASYHKWLTTEDFGRQFGPAPADVAAITRWLQNSGFEVGRIAKGGRQIEFSGTAAQVAAAFHTEIHRFEVNGESHYANSSDPQIPAALAPVVAGIPSLHNFRARTQTHILGKATLPKPEPGRPTPAISLPTKAGGYIHALVPGDFYTIYNEAPLLAQSGPRPPIQGFLERIGVVARSEFSQADFNDFRSIFLPQYYSPLFIVNATGQDPGIVNPDEQAEATLDVEWSSAVAPEAEIDFVVSASSDSTDGVLLSQLYIVDNDVDNVMSTSFGLCEGYMGTAGNLLQTTLYEQAAAQGITVVVATGDSGSAACDSPEASPNPNLPRLAQNGLQVSGLASTQYNVAAGGSQFNDTAEPSKYWNDSAKNKDYSSALGYIPETAWNESCAPLQCGATDANLYAGGGGASSCVTSTVNGNNISCVGGYAKPSWQSGVSGIPNDHLRDLPDISLSAAEHDGYVLCLMDSCSEAGGGSVYLVSGTSASAPAFAGVMALVNQFTGDRQGQANYVLYPLAAAQQHAGTACVSGNASEGNGCIFNDIVSGTNAVPCAGGSPNCSSEQAEVPGTLMSFTAGAGYDQATGLGSLNIANLVTNWNSISFQATTTTLAITPTTLVHGQNANLQVQVLPVGSSSAIPTGNVSLLGGNTNVFAGTAHEWRANDEPRRSAGRFSSGAGPILRRRIFRLQPVKQRNCDD